MPWFLALSLFAAEAAEVPTERTPEAAEPAEPTEPVDPAGPTEPAEPAEPTEPAEPAEPETGQGYAESLSRGTSTGRDWDAVFDRAYAVSVAGEVCAIAGPPLAVVGVTFMFAGAWDGSEEAALAGLGVAVVGAGAMLAGQPMLVGGAMRMRRSLRERGVDAPADLGWVSWGLYAGQYVVPPLLTAATQDDTGSVVGLGLYIGTIATGAVFRGQLRQASEDAGLGARLRGPRVAVLPSKNGLSLVGAF